jgi:glycosyltransferase involved in cell wall biosynthesis
MKISVVIPARNEESHIRGCLECLARQTLPRDQFEVVLVDNGSTDSTVAIGQSFADKLNLKVTLKPKGNISAVRNHGASLGSGEILAFLDADCLAQEKWLCEAISRAPDASIWGAHYLIPENASWVSRVWFEYQAKPYDGVVSFLPSSNTFIRRVDFDRLGGFDESVETSEDVDLCTRASAIGLNIIAISALAVVHERSPRTLQDFYRQNRWHGNHVLRVFLLNLPSLRNARIIAMSLYTLVVFWLTIAATIAAVFWHLWFLPLALLGLLLLPPFILSFYRTAGSRSVSSVTQLWILYTTYLFARAAALTRISKLVKGVRRSNSKLKTSRW